MGACSVSCSFQRAPYHLIACSLRMHVVILVYAVLFMDVKDMAGTDGEQPFEGVGYQGSMCVGYG